MRDTSINQIPRVALFADTFHEANGAANFLRRLVDFVKTKDYPFLCVRAGEETRSFQDGSVTFLDLKRGRASIPLDGALKFDPFYLKHRKLVGKTLTEFAPDIIHFTGLNDISQFGIYLAHFRNIPAVASWHTNAHEYAAKRLVSVIPFISDKAKQKIEKVVEKSVFHGLMRIYFLAQMQLAPNEELVAEIQRLTQRPSFLLGRGVDTDFLSPDKRRRDDDIFTIGFVGRLRPEKNVRLFAELDKALQQAKIENYRFTIVGEGGERNWLQNNLHNARFTGEIRGEELAETIANMDLFVFPSLTDAFGNVVLEAMSAGVPAIVMSKGGQKYLIENGINGFIADEKNFIKTVVQILKNPNQLAETRKAARSFALLNSWEAIFEKTYKFYEQAMKFDKSIRAE